MAIPTTIFDFDQIWLIDFEFSAPPGEVPNVVCLVAKEYYSKQVIRVFQEDLKTMNEPPFRIDCKILVVAYFASAEMGCFKVLGWDYPELLLDLYVEFRYSTNGRPLVSGANLLGALIHFGHDSISVNEKVEMRELAMRGGEFTEQEKIALLDYCQSDVEALDKLLTSMSPQLDLPRALYRGEYMKTVATMEFNGIPIDTLSLNQLDKNWKEIKIRLVEKISQKYPVFEKTTFKIKRFENWLIENKIPWPRLPSGKLSLSDSTFKDMAKSYPVIYPLYQLRETLSKLRLNKLAVSRDSQRNRTLISPFSSVTSRNQPSNSKFIFGQPAWMRALIMPGKGRAIAYIDWSQQEFGIAAKLSNDQKMMEAYRSGDPYIAFAIQAGAAPIGATKKSHSDVRGLFKECVLAVQYCMGEESLATKINRPIAEARELLCLHRKTYKTFWDWSDNMLDFAMLKGFLVTRLGWRINVMSDTNPRTLRNFPMQCNGAEMLRVALNMLREEGIKICAPIHDAILIESSIDKIEEDVLRTQLIMKRASAFILEGFELESDSDIYKFPNRYMDERGEDMWSLVIHELSQITTGGVAVCDTRTI